MPTLMCQPIAILPLVVARPLNHCSRASSRMGLTAASPSPTSRSRSSSSSRVDALPGTVITAGFPLAAPCVDSFMNVFPFMEWTNKDRLSCEKRSVETPSIAIAPVPYRSEGKGRIDGTKKLLDSERVRQHLIARVQTPYAVGG